MHRGFKKPKKEDSDIGIPKKNGIICYSCDETSDHETKECPELGTTIKKMQHAGHNSLKIAEQLHISSPA
jgi:hypothetical protein